MTNANAIKLLSPRTVSLLREHAKALSVDEVKLASDLFEMMVQDGVFDVVLDTEKVLQRQTSPHHRSCAAWQRDRNHCTSAECRSDYDDVEYGGMGLIGVALTEFRTVRDFIAISSSTANVATSVRGIPVGI